MCDAPLPPRDQSDTFLYAKHPRRFNSDGTQHDQYYGFSNRDIPYCGIKRSSSTFITPLSIVIDLDNTLIFASTSPVTISDFVIKILVAPGKYESCFVHKRPDLEQFLSDISKIANLYLYTASTREYCEQILSNIDPFGKYFKKVLCREDCIQDSNGSYIKDISKLKLDCTRTLIIDNDRFAYGKEKVNSNLLPIIPYFGDYKDCELSKMFRLITSYSNAKDVRAYIMQRNP